MNFLVAKFYAHVYIFFKKYFNLQIPGLGFFLRRIKNDRIIDFRSQKMFVSKEVSSSYGIHIVGELIEPETHFFLEYLLKNINSNIIFFDVGCNIGAFLIDVAKHPNSFVYGFEPSERCIESVEKSMKLNSKTNYSLFNILVGDDYKLTSFSEGADPQGASILTNNNSNNIKLITQTK